MAQDFYDDPDYAEIDRARREEWQRKNAVLAEQDKIAAAEAKARVDATTQKANESALLGAYLESGVEPPFTNGAGLPTVSLTLLKWQGWRVERDGNRMVLLPPHSRPQPRREEK